MTSPRTIIDWTPDTYVNVNQFLLFDFTSDKSPLSLTFPPNAEALAVSGDGGARFRCNAGLTEATARLELWDRPPDPPPGAWDDVYEGTFTTDTGHLVLGDAAPTDVHVTLPQAGRWSLRVYRSHQLVPAPEDAGGGSMNREHWLIQVW